MSVEYPLRFVANNSYHFQLIPTKTDDMRERAYINVSGAAINSNKSTGSFEVNATQYTSHYKNNRSLSILPVHAHFTSGKYKTKKPVPSNNTYVSVEGFLDAIGTDSHGNATAFHISVDNINFLGKAAVSSATSATTGIVFGTSTLHRF